MHRALLTLPLLLAATHASADKMATRFCDLQLTTARALLDADVVLETEVLEFSSHSTPTQVGHTYTWKAKVKVTSVVLGSFPEREATFTETCSGGSSDGQWIPPCEAPMPQTKGEKATLFMKKAPAGFTFVRTQVEQRHASDCPDKKVIDEAKKQHAEAWAKVAPKK